MTGVLAVLAGAGLFAWPAVVNLYPILFSDTGGFLEQALMPDTGWDKPWVYGPFLTPFHGRVSLWGAVAAQCVVLSAMLFMVQAVLRPPSALRHLAVCGVLAVVSAAPWFASLLMPDVFAPVTVLALFVLMQGRMRWWVLAVATVAIASHLAHLVLAAGCLAGLLVAYGRVPWRPAIPLVAALALLLGANWVMFGRVAVSPYGGLFALARLVGDGPAIHTIDAACPEAGYRVCAWKGRLPADSDAFLWDPQGPVWADGFGPLRFAAEADTIVRDTLRREPWAVLEAALRNTGRQLLRVAVGDTLGAEHLDVAVLERIETYFPAAEAARFRASRQARGALEAVAAPLRPVHVTTLLAGAVLTVSLAVGMRRHDPGLWRLALVVLVALLANAAATGALSGPHDRYQARIAWLLLLPPLFYVRPAFRAGFAR